MLYFVFNIDYQHTQLVFRSNTNVKFQKVMATHFPNFWPFANFVFLVRRKTYLGAGTLRQKRRVPKIVPSIRLLLFAARYDHHSAKEHRADFFESRRAFCSSSRKIGTRNILPAQMLRRSERRQDWKSVESRWRHKKCLRIKKKLVQGPILVYC